MSTTTDRVCRFEPNSDHTGGILTITQGEDDFRQSTVYSVGFDGTRFHVGRFGQNDSYHGDYATGNCSCECRKWRFTCKHIQCFRALSKHGKL
jgi:hypothetical protein